MFEAETGLTINEPGTLAVKATVESAVVELIREGERKGVWDFKQPDVVVQPATPAAPVAVAPVVEAKKEVVVTPETVKKSTPKDRKESKENKK
jgi:hypothetical protein